MPRATEPTLPTINDASRPVATEQATPKATTVAPDLLTYDSPLLGRAPSPTNEATQRERMEAEVRTPSSLLLIELTFPFRL